ncbi:MAG TPA: sugar nucleotide-binding protein [Verrucomicrobiales bacterium]|nr:sugar nucleotide-binding protein [Verrucomicrobiales bacterium]
MAKPITIFTGGSGLLGNEFRKIAPDFLFPLTQEFDVTNYQQMERYAETHGCNQVIHAAAFTSPPVVEKDPLKALDVNIIGTANVVKLCIKFGARLIYICTDYVFPGDKGLYAESDPVNPVNKYAWSKLGGECAARLYDKALIVRTTFGPDRFPFERAFSDQWTSREPVSVIAKKLKALAASEALGVVHVGGGRRTVLEYARSLDPSRDIGELSIKDVPFKVPVDTSLNCDRYNQVLNQSEK